MKFTAEFYMTRFNFALLEYPQLKDRVIMLDGWSKTYAMTGWRIGYGVWPKEYASIAEQLNINSFFLH